MKIGFTKSEIDECGFYRGSFVYILYKYDSIIAGPNQEDMDAVVADLKKANLEVTVEGTLEVFLGVNINRRKDGRIHLTQPYLIE